MLCQLLIDYTHKSLDNRCSQTLAFRFLVMGQPIDRLCVTLTLLLQNMYQFHVHERKNCILMTICFSSQEK